MIGVISLSLTISASETKQLDVYFSYIKHKRRKQLRIKHDSCNKQQLFPCKTVTDWSL